jgi:hypothetical protein
MASLSLKIQVGKNVAADVAVVRDTFAVLSAIFWTLILADRSNN